jgi:hypothetical protein
MEVRGEASGIKLTMGSEGFSGKGAEIEKELKG